MPDQPDSDDRAMMEEILRSEVVGHLAMACGDEPYVVPINYAYGDGRILLHCALDGRKLGFLRGNPAVCFEVCRQDASPTPHAEDSCDAAFVSVICYGTARIIEDLAERQALLSAFQARYSTAQTPREPISLDRAVKCGAIEITVTRMTGRRHTGQEEITWEWEA